MKKHLVYIFLFIHVFSVFGQSEQAGSTQNTPLWLLMVLIIVAATLSFFLTRSHHLRKRKDVLECKENHACDKYKVQKLCVKEERLRSYVNAIRNKNAFLDEVRTGMETMRNKEAKQWVNKISNELVNEGEEYYSLFEAAYPDFLSEIKLDHPKLTAKDMKMLSLLRMGLSAEEMAPLLDISPSSVTANRYRLKSKMGLEKAVDLEEYLKTY